MFPTYEIGEGVTEEGWFFKPEIETDEEANERALGIIARLQDMSL
jgi:hypothetical protein